jgi:hypothetical protein
MNNIEKINDFRQQALYYSKAGKRFKVLIETVTGCFGSCLGCAFTEDERTKMTPRITAEKLPLLFNRLTELLDYTNPNSIISPYETTVINYGGSEHFIYDNDYLGSLFKETATFFNNVKTERNVLAFSSSGLMNADKMHTRSRDMLKHLSTDQFVVDFVIDLSRFEKLKERYQKSFDFFKENFGFVDLAINIESFSDLRDWQAFCDFIDQNGILNVDLIYSINKNNLHRVPLEADKIFQIYETMVLNTKQGKGLFDLHGLLRIKDNQKGLSEELNNLTLQEVCRTAAKNILHDAIFINSDFVVYPVLFVLFADVPLNERLDVKPIGNLFDIDFKEKFFAYENELYNQLLKMSAKSLQCSNCDFIKECYQTGAPLLNKYLNDFKGIQVTDFESCQNPVKPFLIAKHNNYLILKEDEIA